MKLFVAVTVAEYRDKLETFFSEQQVPFFNEFELKGIHKTQKPQHRLGNWFGAGQRPVNSIAFFTMVSQEQADSLFEGLENCQTDEEPCRIQAYILNIEKGL